MEKKKERQTRHVEEDAWVNGDPLNGHQKVECQPPSNEHSEVIASSHGEILKGSGFGGTSHNRSLCPFPIRAGYRVRSGSSTKQREPMPECLGGINWKFTHRDGKTTCTMTSHFCSPTALPGRWQTYTAISGESAEPSQKNCWYLPNSVPIICTCGSPSPGEAQRWHRISN